MPTLDDDINTLMEALVTRAGALVATAGAQDLALLGHAIAATRGSTALQSIIDAATDALGEVTGSRDAALATLATQLTTNQNALTVATATLVAQLGTVKDGAVSQITGAWLAVAGMRIGDVAWRLFPNANDIPSMILPLIGGQVDATAYNALAGAWGLNPGQTPSDFVTRYNASNLLGITVQVSGGSLYLPNLSGWFPQGVNPTDMGKYFPDMLKTHTHDAPSGGSFTLAATGTDAGSGGTGALHVAGTKTGAPSATSGLTVGAKNKPEAIAGVFVVRAL